MVIKELIGGPHKIVDTYSLKANIKTIRKEQRMAKEDLTWKEYKQSVTTYSTEDIKETLTNVCMRYLKTVIIKDTLNETTEEARVSLEEDFLNNHIPKVLNILTNNELRILFTISDFSNHSLFIPIKEGSNEIPRRNIFNAGHIVIDIFYNGVLGSEPTNDLRTNINNFYIVAWLNTTLHMYDLVVTKEISDAFNNKSDIFTQIKEKGLFKENKKLYKDIFSLEKEDSLKLITGRGRLLRKELTAETKVVTNISKKTNLDLDLQLFNNNDFAKILQGKGTNALMKIKTTSTLEGQIDFMGAATFKTDSDFTLIIKDYAELMNGIPTHAWKLFDCFMLVFTKDKNPSIRLPLKDYMAMRGLKDLKSARKQVLESMDALSKISYEAKEKINGRWVHSGKISLFGGTQIIKNGVIQFNFNTDFYGQLLNYRVMDYPPGVLKTNDNKYPNAFYFHRFIVENYTMNEGKERVSFINVKILMSKSPKMPSYEEVMSSNRNVKDRIIRPFIKDLDSLDNVYYDIVAEDKKTIIDNVEELTYSQFIKCYVKIDYTDYPRNIKRLERKRKHQEATRKKTSKNKEYSKGSYKKLN